MSTKKTVSNTFTVSTVEDGESAPYYFLEWFAWSNDPSTNSVTTAPTIGGTWATSIPAQGNYAYLWRKSIRYVWQGATRTYSAEAAQYFRMSGLNGTSIKTRGQVASASQRGNGTATLTNGTTITMSDGDAVTQIDNGHLYQWVTEGGGAWIDLGQFQGQSGVTYYSHVAWATNVTISGSTVIVTGFVTTKSPNDTTHMWMGVYVDEQSGQDSSNASLYTWSYIKGESGTSPYFADLNNEMDAIQCKHDGSVIADQTVSTVVSMWKGSVVESFVIDNIYRNGTQLTWDGNNNGVWPRVSGSIVSLEFTTSASIADIDDFKITIHSYNDNTITRELHFTINGVRANAIYRLVPSHSQIVKKKDGTYVPSGNVTCSVEKTENGSTSTPSSSEYTLEKSVNGGSYTTYSATAASSITSDLKFSLKVGGVVVDLETIPLVSDGDNGDGGVSYSIVFTKAAARIDENNIVTAELAGYAYKYVGGVRSALTSTTIRYGYILTDSDTYVDTTTNSSGFFDAGTWFNGDDITDYGKNSPSIFAAIVIDGTVVHAEMITISVKGGTGNRGKVGRFFYYAGAWNDFASTDSFLVNDAQAPYFYYNNNYWVFNPETNGTYTKQNMGTPSSSSSNWKLMTSDFKYIITEAIFGSYAHFGGAIINGDYLMSQYGYMLGFCNTKTPINDNTQYQNVDMDDVLGDDDMYDPTKLIWNDSNQREITSTTYTTITSASFVQNRYYTLEIDENTEVSGNEMLWTIVSQNGTEIAGGTIISTANGTNKNCVNFKSTVSATCYLRVKITNQNDAVDIDGFYLRFAKFIPYLAMDLLSGKFVANNIIARGELHSDSLYHTMVYGNSNNDRFTINDESIVNLGTKAVGTTVILPSTSSCKGRVIELFNHATSFYTTWVGASSTSTFSAAYGSGLGIRVIDSISYKYIKFYCDGTNWWILRAEG